MVIDDKTKQVIKQVQDIFDSNVYLVGGAVRDVLMGNTPKDYDFSCDILPDEIEKQIRLRGYKVYTLGKKFGTLGFKLPFNDTYEIIEITTFRGEDYKPENRKPEVNFIKNINQDLARRDFSINAMAISSKLKLIDNFNGLEDIKNNIIRCAQNPTIKFKEDPLRILRAFRFASRFNFEIDYGTMKSIQKKKFGLYNISKERWKSELDKILLSLNPIKGLSQMMESGVFKIIIPELSLQYQYDQNSPYHDFDLWTHTLKVVENVSKEKFENQKEKLIMMYTALLHDIAKPVCRSENSKGHSNYIGHELVGSEMVKMILKHLKFSNHEIKNISLNILEHLKCDSKLKKYDDAGKKISPESNTLVSTI